MKLTDCYFYGNSGASGICGNNTGIIENCDAAGVVNASIGSAGGICGYSGENLIKGCTSEIYNSLVIFFATRVKNTCFFYLYVLVYIHSNNT